MESENILISTVHHLNCSQGRITSVEKDICGASHRIKVKSQMTMLCSIFVIRQGLGYFKD